MSTQTRHRRRSREANTHNGATVTLKNPEFIKKLRNEYIANATQARSAEAAAKRGFTDAAGFDQQVNDLGVKEQAILARIRSAQAELEQVQRNRQEQAKLAEQARDYGADQAASSEKFTEAADDVRAVLERFEIDVPDVPDKDAPQQNGNAGALATVVDPTQPTPEEKARLDGAMSRIDGAFAELPADQRDEGEL
jgi:seryl-tRNA synthetase